MEMENQDDSFVFLQNKECYQDNKPALDHIRFGNHSLDEQFKRDIELLSLAIVECGSSEQAKMKADILLKSMLLLFFGRVCYRNKNCIDQSFYPFSDLEAYFEHSIFNHFPIAAILLHGSRVLIEFPHSIASELMDSLIVDKSNWRYMATHGISALEIAEVVDPQSIDSTDKFLKEEKVSLTTAAINLVSNSVTGLWSNTHLNKVNCADHYGFDLALGGVGNRHFVSKEIIRNNGEHGHLYIHFYQDLTQQKHSGLLLGIEQSAPGKPDHYGGQHDVTASEKEYSASGGDFFGKKPKLALHQKEYQGLTILPFAHYYDSLWNGITQDTLVLIKNSFAKCQCLLTLLTQEKRLEFIKQLLTGSAGSKQQDFDKLFDHYFQQTPQNQLQLDKQNELKEDLENLQRCIEKLISQMQHLELEIPCLKAEIQQKFDVMYEQHAEEIMNLQDQLEDLTIEKNNLEKNNQELATELSLKHQQSNPLSDKNILLLVTRSYDFMQTVINQMGWFAKKSAKRNILLALQQQTLKEGINTEQLTNLLKNFMSVCLMNRYHFKNQTQSAKACLTQLKRPGYRSLITLLHLQNPEHYQDLIKFVYNHANNEETPIKYFVSATYRNDLYTFYQKKGSRQMDENQLNLATHQIVYQPPQIQN